MVYIFWPEEVSDHRPPTPLYLLVHLLSLHWFSINKPLEEIWFINISKEFESLFHWGRTDRESLMILINFDTEIIIFGNLFPRDYMYYEYKTKKKNKKTILFLIKQNQLVYKNHLNFAFLSRSTNIGKISSHPCQLFKAEWSSWNGVKSKRQNI